MQSTEAWSFAMHFASYLQRIFHSIFVAIWVLSFGDVYLWFDGFVIAYSKANS
jgi:hypothetical protein